MFVLLSSLIYFIFKFWKQEREQFYNAVNHNGVLIVRAMDAYTNFLSQQTATMVTAFSHIDAIHHYLTLLHTVIDRGSYYVTYPQLKTMLEWATLLSNSPQDSEPAWNLLFTMVYERKEIKEEAGLRFVTECLCEVDAAAVTKPAWRCITAFLASVVDWEANLKEKQSRNGGRDLCYEISINKDIDWQPWRKLFTGIILRSGEESAVTGASLLLARLVAFDARGVMSAEEHKALLTSELETWLGELRTSVGLLCGRQLPLAWHAVPCLDPSLSADDAHMALQTTHRSLFHLKCMVESGYHLSMPSRFGHAANYREDDVMIEVQYHVQGPPVPQKFNLCVPANSYVGYLRTSIAEALKTKIHLTSSSSSSTVDRSLVRIFCGGKEYSNDSLLLSKSGIKSPVSLAFSQAPNAAWNLSESAREALDAASPALLLASGSFSASASPSSSLAPSPGGVAAAAADAFSGGGGGGSVAEIYGLALAMEQLEFNSAHGADQGLLITSARVHEVAREVLNLLPTCESAMKNMMWLLDGEGALQHLYLLLTKPAPPPTSFLPPTQDQQQQHHHHHQQQQLPPPPLLKVAVARYAVETLCSLVRPARNPFVSEDEAAEVEIKSEMCKCRLFPSDVLPIVLHLAADASLLSIASRDSGDNSVPALFSLHFPLLLLANTVCTDILRQRNISRGALMTTAAAVDPVSATHQEQQEKDQEDAEEEEELKSSPEDSSAAIAVADYTLKMMLSVLKTRRQHGNIVSVRTLSDQLFTKGLQLLHVCIDAVPELADVLIAQEQQQHEQYRNGAHQNCSEILARLISSLLEHNRKSMRVQMCQWVEMFAGASHNARQWIFSHAVTPLLLTPDANEEQIELAKKFLSSLDEGEAGVAESLLEQLVGRLLEAAEEGGPLYATVGNIITLVKQLEAYSIGEVCVLKLVYLLCCVKET